MRCAARRVPPAPPLTRGLKAVFLPPSPGGTVESVFASTVVLKGPPHAGLGARVRFPRSGGEGTTTSLTTDGRVVVTLLKGARPASGDTGLMAEATPLSLPLSPLASVGRVLDVLGAPLDGPPILGARPCRFVSPSPGIVDRGPYTTQLPTHTPAVDAFTPLLRGTSLALLADVGGAAASATQWLRSIGGGSARRDGDALVVLALGGRTRASIAAVVAALSARGDLAHTVVIAAPTDGGYHPGCSALLPLAGVAVGESLAALGAHALVLHDDLSQAVAADGAGDFAAAHAGLWDRCAQFSDARGGGSVTSVGLLLVPRRGAANATTAGERVRSVCYNLASLADTRLTWGAGDVTATTPLSGWGRGWSRLPMAAQSLGVTPGHAAQGQMLRWLTERARTALSEAKEAGAAVQTAAAYGVPAEAASDALNHVLDAAAELLLRVPLAGVPHTHPTAPEASIAQLVDDRRAALLAKLDPAQRALVTSRRAAPPSASPAANAPPPSPTLLEVVECPLQRTALTLFLVSTGYAVRVPRSRVAEWEAGLWEVCSTLPVPPAWGGASLLASLLDAPPPLSPLRVSLDSTLRAGTHKLLEGVAYAVDPPAPPPERASPPADRGVLSILTPFLRPFRQRPAVAAAPPPSPPPTPPAPAAGPLSAWEQLATTGVPRHLLLDPGEDYEEGWAGLPPQLRALHVVVSAYTKDFTATLPRAISTN